MSELVFQVDTDLSAFRTNENLWDRHLLVWEFSIIDFRNGSPTDLIGFRLDVGFTPKNGPESRKSGRGVGSPAASGSFTPRLAAVMLVHFHTAELVVTNGLGFASAG